MRKGVYRGWLFGCLAVAAGCVSTGVSGALAEDSKPSDAAKPEPHFAKLGHHSRKIATTVPAAQEYFDQGLAFLFGFNHDEAIRSFKAAAEADPHCAMAYWGVAIANGPHINNAKVDKAHAKAAWRALKKARDLAPEASSVDQALIEALGHRYADPQPDDRKSLDEAYADAMRKVWKAHPDDSDVGALTAEAIMDLRPWDQWTPEGKPQPGTEEVLGILDAVLRQSPKHPLAAHLMIHAAEASRHPERADAAAEALRDLMPGVGHLVHMPSHIDVRRGRWQEAVLANEKAISADNAYYATVPGQGFYRLYMAHNHHMLAYAAMMQGQSLKASATIKEMLAGVPEAAKTTQADILDGFFAIPYELHLRFGQWDEMLAEPKPPENFPIATALWHYARGVAFAAKTQIEPAKAEQKEFEAAVKRVPETAMFGKNSASDLLGVAEKMLAGEIALRQGDITHAIDFLQQAVEREDKLRYAEPPAWMQPVRHALGVTLLLALRFADAEKVYREDLARYPENGWSLFGLSQALESQGKKDQALAVKLRFDKAWERADVKIKSSCFCLMPK
jgi:tetratricopeptide (TPR) repeat protein